MANTLNQRGFYRRVVLQIFIGISQGRGIKEGFVPCSVFEDTISGGREGEEGVRHSRSAWGKCANAGRTGGLRRDGRTYGGEGG
jgi:hypothetical protein